jgi:hypothetical protein
MISSQATVADFVDPFPKTINEINAHIDQYNLILTNRAALAAKAKNTSATPTPNNG